MNVLGKKKLGDGTSGDAILLMIAKLITIGSTMVITRLLSESLSVYHYGTYSQILLIVSTVTSVTILGMMDGVNYFYCNVQDPEKRESYISTIFALQSIVGTVSGAIIMALSTPLCLYFENPQIRNLLVFAAVLPLLQNLFWLYHMLIVSIGKSKMLALRNLVNAVIKLISFSLILALNGGVADILTVTLVIDIVQIVYFHAVIRKNGCRIRFRKIRLRLSGDIFRYCLPMALFVMINALNRDVDKYIVSLWTDTETMAIYSNAAKTLPFDIVMTSFYTVLMPKITKMIAVKEYRSTVMLYRSFLELSYVTTCILCCAALSVAPQLMTLLYSEKYMEGLNVFCIYIMVDLIRFTTVTIILSAMGKTKTIFRLGACALACNAVFNILLFRAFGITGPAIATLLSTALLGIFMLRKSAVNLQAKVRNFFDGKFVLMFLMESLVLTVLAHLLQKLMADKGIHYFVILVTVCILYGGIMFALNGKRIIKNLQKISGKGPAVSY